MLFGSLWCDFEYYNTYALGTTKEVITRGMSYIESAMRYAKTDWLSKQSFCYEDQESVELFSTMTVSGLAFGFNLNGKIYDQIR
jgi:hypothetical protein